MTRPALETTRIYSYGLVRLPASFRASRVTVTWDKKMIRIAPATEGELSLKTFRSGRAVSPLLNLKRVFRRMRVSMTLLAGEYKTEITNGTLTIEFGREACRR